jgi:protein SDA1
MDSEADSDSDGWENVSSDGEDLVLSDSDDEEKVSGDNKVKRKRLLGKRKRAKGDTGSDGESDEDESDDETRSVVSTATDQTTTKLSLLAQQKILTPADFALLNELKLKAAQDLASNGGGSAAKRKLAALEAAKKNHADADTDSRFLTENEILGPRKKAKMDYEERMESIQKGREGREKFGSKKGKQDKDAKSSSTNREKNKNKPIMMALQCVYYITSTTCQVLTAVRTGWSARKRRRCATSRSSCALRSTSGKSRSDSTFACSMWILAYVYPRVTIRVKQRRC